MNNPIYILPAVGSLLAILLLVLRYSAKLKLKLSPDGLELIIDAQKGNTDVLPPVELEDD
jgi:hypothetical protein